MSGPAREDNFDFLRLLASGLVLVSHAWPLSGRHDEPLGSLIGFTTLGGLGVDIFFVISGYLVLGSWLRDPDVPRFAARRFLRIYPGLAVLVLVTILLAPLVSTLGATAFWSDPATRAYLNVLLLYPMPYTLPGVFAGNPIPGVVNGSLWTLPVETTMYVGLASLGAAGLARRPGALAALALVLLALSELAWRALPQPWGILFLDLRYVLDLGAYFFAGAALYAWRDRLRPTLWVTALLLLGFALAQHLGWGRVAAHLLIPYAVIAIAYARLPWVSHAGRYGDFSYGIYIYAYPVQQAVVHFSANQLPLPAMIAIQATCTLAAAWLSWHFIESPALAHKPSIPGRAPRPAAVQG